MSDYCYHAFGQVILSEFPIDVLEPAHGGKPTLEVRLTDDLRQTGLPEDPYFDVTQERQFFEWKEVGAFEVTAPGIILVDPRPDVSWHLVSQPLLGIVISVALERLGLFCLHGGSVDLEGGAAIVLGDKGAGKSTTVSSLLRAGHWLLTDDLVALDCGDFTLPPVVQSGFPAVKLWPDSADALSVDTSEGTAQVHHSISKVQKKMDSAVMAKPAPASAVFILSPEKNGKTHAVRLPETSALEALLYFAFIARFGNTAMGKTHLANFMRRCCYVVKTTPVYMLHVRRDFDRIDELVQEIQRVTRSTDLSVEHVG